MVEKICNIRYLSSKNPDIYDTIIPNKVVYSEKTTPKNLSDSSDNIATTEFVGDVINDKYKAEMVELFANVTTTPETSVVNTATLKMIKINKFVLCTLYGLASVKGGTSPSENYYEFDIPSEFRPKNDTYIFKNTLVDSSPYGCVVASGTLSFSSTDRTLWSIVAIKSSDDSYNDIYSNLNKPLKVALMGEKYSTSPGFLNVTSVPFTYNFWYKI